MHVARFFSALIGCLLAAGPAAAQVEITTEILAQSTTSWDGEPFVYPEGTPEITVVRIRIPEGSALPWHCHPMPLAGVLTKGRLVVTKRDGARVTVEEGEGLIEVSRQWHRGAAEKEAEIIVVYAGAVGMPTGFGESAEPHLAELCR
jgi:quercetin dioxygenase-like cupin family protein